MAAALAPGDQIWVAFDNVLELVNQPALAHAGHGHERHQLRDLIVDGAVEGVAQDRHLALAANELGPRVVGDVRAEARARAGRLPNRNGLGLALGLDCFGRLVVDRGPGRPARRVVYQDAEDLRRCL